jgi:hypothetical protein
MTDTEACTTQQKLKKKKQFCGIILSEKVDKLIILISPVHVQTTLF